jgi:hypothetical protein
MAIWNNLRSFGMFMTILYIFCSFGTFCVPLVYFSGFGIMYQEISIGENSPNLGPMLWFFEYFRRNILREIVVFDSKLSKILQKFYHNIGIWENANFFAENREKSLKIVIITSIPGHPKKESILRMTNKTSD